ncbi:L-ascorbate metabolism protein UlaG, beta-lactamase superfamily [bacterium A37T11]|nr:L-ascorbate metabolism protein UlaG, beta-lactamase superfamily [bacterium A37T11]
MFIIIFTIIVLLIALVVYLFMQLPSFGKKPSGERLRRIEQSRYYKNGKFQTRPDIDKTPKTASLFRIIPELLNHHPRVRPSKPLPVIRSDLKAVVNDGIVITWFGHSSYLIQLRGTNILVDPVFGQRPSPVNFMGTKRFDGTQVFTAAGMPVIDLLILSHDHYDHLDYETILKLKPKIKQILTPLGVGSHLEYWGYNPAIIHEVDWWDEFEFGKIKFTATPGIHFSGRGLNQNKTFWSSFVMETGGTRIFLGGDSGYGEHYKALGNKFGPFELAIIECGQYNKLWPDIHHMPEQTAQAAVDLKAKVLLPVHWAKFALSQHPWDEPIKRLIVKANELGLLVTTPIIGEKIVVNETYPTTQWWESIH